LKGGTVQIFGNNLNKSKLYVGRYSEQIEVRECLLSFGAESFGFQFAIQKFEGFKIYRTIILPGVCMGVKLGRSY